MILQSLLIALIETFNLIINLYILIIVASALISWVQPNPYNPIVQILHKLTAPAYRLVKKIFNPVIGMIDLTPIVIILALQFLNIFLTRALLAFANAL